MPSIKEKAELLKGLLFDEVDPEKIMELLDCSRATAFKIAKDITEQAVTPLRAEFQTLEERTREILAPIMISG